MTSRSSSQRQAIVVAVVLWLLGAPGGVLAQSTMRGGCEDCVVPRVSVPGPSVDVLRQAVAREGARLAVAISATSPQQPPQQRRWIGRHPVLGGALIGAAAGFTVGAVALRGEPHGCGCMTGRPIEGGLFYTAPLGALVGAAVGKGVEFSNSQ
jgi:hypothetical protein